MAPRDDVSKAAAAMGRAGKGASKVRGDAGHYAAMAARSAEVRRAKKVGPGAGECEAGYCHNRATVFFGRYRRIAGIPSEVSRLCDIHAGRAAEKEGK